MSPITIQVIGTIAGIIVAGAGLGVGVLRVGAWWVRQAIHQENQKLLDKLNGRYVSRDVCDERHRES